MPIEPTRRMVPFEILPEADLVLWADIDETRFTDPFYRWTLFRHGTERGTPLFHPGGLAELEALADPGHPLDGTIFHVSRCGSTLLSRMLAVAPEHLVLSEAQPVNAILQQLEQLAPARRARLLRGLVAGFVRARGGAPRVFLKCTSWHTRHLLLLRAAFPAMRWIFLYRDPVEVLVSQHRGSGGIPRELWFRGGEQLSSHAMVYAQSCETALAHARDPLGRLVNYQELLEPEGLRRALAHLGVEADATILELAAQYSKKTDGRPFEPDGAAKQGEAPPRVRQLVRQLLQIPYATLEAARARQARS